MLMQTATTPTTPYSSEKAVSSCNMPMSILTAW